MAEKKRCRWVVGADPAYIAYHDKEWGRPVHDDRHLFEMLTLKGAQAGLSWSTTLHKRDGYRKAFANFDPRKVARIDSRKRQIFMANTGIVHNRLKIDSTVTNAHAFLEVQHGFGSFDRYLWSFATGRQALSSASNPSISASA